MITLIFIQFLCMAWVLLAVSNNIGTRTLLHKHESVDTFATVCVIFSFIPYLGILAIILAYLFYLEYKQY